MQTSSLTDASILECDEITAVFGSGMQHSECEDTVNVFRRADHNPEQQSAQQSDCKSKHYTVQIHSAEELRTLRTRVERVRGDDVGIVPRKVRRHELAQLSLDALFLLHKKRMGIPPGTIPQEMNGGLLSNFIESIVDAEYGESTS